MWVGMLERNWMEMDEYSAIVVPVDEPVFPSKGIEPVIPPPSTNITIRARITVRPQTSISLPPKAEVERLLAMTTPSPSPPISLSPPSAGERLARCMASPAHLSPLLPSSGFTAALPSPPLPPLPPSLYIPPCVDRRDDIPESEQPPRKRLYLSTLGSRYEVRESSTARPTRDRGIDYRFVSTVDAEERRQGIRDVRYGIRDTWVDPADDSSGASDPFVYHVYEIRPISGTPNQLPAGWGYSRSVHRLRSTGNPNVANTQKGNGAAPKGNGCFECGAPGHFKRDCPKLKNKDGGNGNVQVGFSSLGNARRKKRGNCIRKP
ncbi:putative reverse transcriptase domain-containing protein [Tanacetum coccineum]